MNNQAVQPNAACRFLQDLAAKIAAEVPAVRRDYPTLADMAGLIARTGALHSEEAIRYEARRRVLRGAA